ncbi:hypothetical protein [Fusobacterium varium]|uniref:hypothetical protein n=1 Tax=Fusobacterium varium TaxID=856 RepID=UPI003F08C72F
MEGKKRCFDCEHCENYDSEAMIYFCHKIEEFVEYDQVICEDFNEKNTEDDFLEGL